MQSNVAKSLGNIGSEWTGVLLTLISSSLFLWVIGILLLFWLHDDNIVNFFKENTNIVVELTSNSTRTDADKVENVLRAHTFIRPKSIVFIPKNEAMNIMKSDLGADILEGVGSNPFRDIFIFNVKAKFSSKGKIGQLIQDLKRQSKVEDVYAQTEYLEYWDIWKHRINRMLSIFGMVLMILAIGLIFNMLRLMIDAKSYSIHLLQLVGASWSFIRLPFYRKSFKYAVGSASVASILLGLTVVGVLLYLPGMAEYFNMKYVILTMIFLLLFSLVLFLSGTFVVLRKFLGH